MSSPAPGSVKTFSCPGCGGTVTIRAVGISITAVCMSCSSVIDVANENFAIIKTAKTKTHEIVIPIGKRGTLFGDEWEVIGYVERSGSGDDGEIFGWEEYLLYNPWQGFRFLVRSDGHWSFIKVLRKQVNSFNTSGAHLGNTSYKFFYSYTAVVRYALGEFYWRVKVGEKALVTDYIAPPLQLTCEATQDEVNWSQATYVEPETIAEAFGLEALQEPVGVGTNQPSPYAAYLPGMMKLAMLSIVLLTIAQLILTERAQNTKVYTLATTLNAQQKEQVFSSPPFELTGGNANVELITNSPVDNNWLELNASLAEEKLQETYQTAQVVEYYHGHDSDGNWTEGGQSQSTMFSAVPAGTYRLLINADAGAFTKQQTVSFNTTVMRDVPSSSNFFAALLALMLFPGITWFRHWAFEQRRISGDSDTFTNASKPLASFYIILTIFAIIVAIAVRH